MVVYFLGDIYKNYYTKTYSLYLSVNFTQKVGKDVENGYNNYRICPTDH